MNPEQIIGYILFIVVFMGMLWFLARPPQCKQPEMNEKLEEQKKIQLLIGRGKEIDKRIDSAREEEVVQLIPLFEEEWILVKTLVVAYLLEHQDDTIAAQLDATFKDQLGGWY